MTELSLAHSYAFRWQDARSGTLRRQARSSWLTVFLGLGVLLLILLLSSHIFLANERVRLQTASRSITLQNFEAREAVSSLALELARARSPQELERTVERLGLVAPDPPRYLSL